MKYVSVSQMRLIDKKAVEYGMPIELMMENAGQAISNYVLKKIQRNKLKKILVIAGKGNNGGGVIAACRFLSIHDVSLKLVVLGNKNLLSIPSKVHLNLIRKNPKIKIIYFSKNLKTILHEIEKSELILDGIFGIGINRDIVEPHYSIISAINNSQAYVVSNDIPSGIHADSGQILKTAVKSDYLLVLHKPKKWMLKMKIPSFTVVNIGIPLEIDKF